MYREVVSFLHADGWPVAPGTYDGLPCIDTRFIGSTAAWDCRARPYDPFGQLAFESVLPTTVAAPHREDVMRLVVRTNWRLLTGAFQLDLDGGDLVFRTMLCLPDGVETSHALCRGLIYGNVLTVDRCLPQLLDAAAGGDASAAFESLAL
jgi:hypothetical protein